MNFPQLLKRPLAVFTLVLIILFLTAHALSRELNHDEEQFVSAGALLLRSGLLPYRDYPFIQMPNLAFIYAPLFSTNPYLLLTARGFNLACAAVLLILIFVTAGRQLGTLQGPRWFVGAGCAMILCLNPLALFTIGRAWNHDLPVLATTAALLAMLRGLNSKRALSWFFLCGSLLGIGIGTRLTFAPLPAAFILALIILPATHTSRVKSLILFFTGLLVALIPSIALFVLAPSQFRFGNFIYHGPIEELFRQNTFPYKITLLHRTLFALKQLAASPSTLALGLGFIFLGIRPWYRAGWREMAGRREILTICLVLPFLFIGCCWIPIPPHRQYYYALIPILLLGNVYALARERFSSRLITHAVVLFIALELIESFQSFSHEQTLLHPSRWESVLVHKHGMEIRKYVQSGPILTLQPIYPLEGRLTIYKELATGTFVWRTAHFLSLEQKEVYDVLDRTNLDSFLQSHPPAAVFTGSQPGETKLPSSLLNSLERNGYVAHALGHRWTIWVPQNSEDR